MRRLQWKDGNEEMKKIKYLAVYLLTVAMAFGLTVTWDVRADETAQSVYVPAEAYNDNPLVELPTYVDSPYAVINDNEPCFSYEDRQCTEAFEYYSDLDELGRCGVAYANICAEIEPTEARGDISSVHPTGWHSNMGWERCHLIGFQLAGENANEKNLITGTDYFNVTGMLPFENMVDDYVDETGNHVLYRVTPYFEGDNLIASGVTMEAYSVEDEGEGICFNVYVFNVSPTEVIDYATGVAVDIDQEDSTITLADKTATYNGKNIYIGKATVTGSTGYVTYIYYTDSKCTNKTTKSANGATSSGGAPANAGTYYVKATVAADYNFRAATSKAAKLTINKKSQYIAGITTSKTYNYSTKSRSFSVGATTTYGSVKYKKISGSARLSITSAGKVTVKAKTKAGTYKMKISLTAPSNKNYTGKTIYKTVVVKVKATTKASKTVYWTYYGKKYHCSKACKYIKNSKKIYSGTNPGSRGKCSYCW